MRILILLFLLPVFATAQKSYWVTNYTTFDGLNAFVSLPASYADSAPKRYPVILFIPGNGEVGTDTNNLKKYGPHRYIRDSIKIKGIPHPVTGDTIESIIISVQPSAIWVSQAQVKKFIDSLRIGTRWRVDTFRINVTGLSAGGLGFANHISKDTIKAKQIASFVSMHQPLTDNGATDAIKYSYMANYVRKGGLIWGFEDTTADARKMNTTRDSCNRAVPGSYRYTGRPTVSGGHCCWNNWYTPNYTESVSGVTMNVYQWMLTQARPGAYTYWETPGSVNALAGSDTAYPYNQGGLAVTFSLAGSQTGATSPTYSWAALAGNPASTTITSPSSTSTTVTGANVPGYYGYVLTVTEGAEQDKDTVYIQLRDLMKKGIRPCRTGTKQRFYFGGTLGSGVSTTDIYAPYLTRDNVFPSVMGGDTIVILKNPNNDTGYWKWVFLGDISGGPGCPIVIAPDTSGSTVVSSGPGGSRGWYLGTEDSAVLSYIKFDGGAWYNKTGVRHGFAADNSQYPYDSADATVYTLNTGAVLNLGHHIEFTGWRFNNSTYMFQIKKNSDSTKQFTYYDNFRFNNIYIHHNYGYKTGSEGMYLGHTDWNGLSQVGNDGRTNMMDSLVVEYNVLHKTGKDGLQIANQISSATIRNNLVYQSGYRNASSHRWSIFIGGNATGSMYGNTIINARGAAGSLGMGKVYFYNNIIDSVGEGGNTEPAIYVNQAGWTGNTDSLKMFIYGNVINRVLKTGNNSFVQVDNLAGLMGKGAIRNNVFVHPSKTLISQMVTTAASDTVENNTIVNTGSYDLSTSPLGTIDSYRMYSVLQAAGPGVPVSFYDLPSQAQPQRGFKIRGRGIRFKRN